MAEITDLRIQFLRGTTVENDAYTGPEGEFTIDTDKKEIRMHDGVTAGGTVVPNINTLQQAVNQAVADSGGSTGGGTASDKVYVEIVDYAAGNFNASAGVTVTKEYSDSSIRIQHGLGKRPSSWFGLNLSASPATGITPGSTRNIQVVDDNTVIITNVSSFQNAEFTITF